jgi:hypothetical protein
MLGFILNLLLSRRINSTIFVSFMLDMIDRTYNLRKQNTLLGPNTKARFISIIEKTRSKNRSILPSVERHNLQVIIVSTEKDFALLNSVISGILESCKNFYINSIKLVVPGHFVDHVILRESSRANPLIQVIDENTVFDTKRIREVFSRRFSGRENWCLQQFLKYFSILNSDAKYVLIVDSDTILLRPVPWLTREGKFLQTPTAEYQAQYYTLLINLGVIDELPPFSFVPHHMFYSIDAFRDVHALIGNPSPLELAETVEKLSDESSPSPFCIDYELYAQFMFKHNSNKIEVARWANLSLSRHTYSQLQQIPLAMKFLKFFFNSISIHSWAK